MPQLLEKEIEDREFLSDAVQTAVEVKTPARTLGAPNQLQGYTAQQLKVGLTLWLSDCVALLFSLTVGLLLAATIGHVINHAFAFLALAIAAYSICVWSTGLYPGIALHPAVELKSQYLALFTASSALLIGLTFVSSWHSPYSIAIVCAVPMLLILLPINRSYAKSVLRKLQWGIPCFYLGSFEDVSLVHSQMNKFGWTMLHPVGWFCDQQDEILGDNRAEQEEPAEDCISQTHYLGDTSKLLPEAKAKNVHWIFFVGNDPGQLSLEYPELMQQFPQIVCTRAPRTVARTGTAIVCCGLANGVRIEDTLLLPGPRIAKRMIDVVVSGVALLLLSPLFLTVSLLIKLSSPGPVYFSHKRIGRGGTFFNAWKFRSMVPNAQRVLEDYLNEHPELRDEWDRDHKLKNDPRITWIGKLIRKTSLDELPQLWNVFVGEMSLVGPRPIVEEEITKYGPTFRDYLRVTPGITGLWQISGRNNTTYAERLEYDEFYVRNWSPWMDLYILLRTVRTVLLCEGAY